jgi:glutathione S-transferase
MLYIADLHPEAKLAPAISDPARPEFLRWTMFMAAALYPALLRWFYAPRYTSDQDGVEAVKDAALAEIDRCFGIIEAALADRLWIAGEDFTIADPYLLMLAHWHPVDDRPRPEWKRIVDFCARAGAIPALASLNASHKIW